MDDLFTGAISWFDELRSILTCDASNRSRTLRVAA